MNAHIANDAMSFPARAAGTRNGFASSAAGAAPGWFSAASGWVSSLLQRRTVMAELARLSEHELKDIGLTRADIPHVFDRHFIAGRSLPGGARR